MKKRLQAIAVPALCVCFFCPRLMFSTAIAAEADVGETKLIVWDALQPDFQVHPITKPTYQRSLRSSAARQGSG